MKKMKMAIALCLALLLCLNVFVSVSAAEAHDALIDEEAKASLTLWKYDWTNACKDGVWNEDSFTSTGWSESYVEEMLGAAVREGDANGETDNPLGNGQNSDGYAIKGVGFTIAKVANIVTYSEAANDQHPDYNTTFVLYGFHKEKSAELLAAIGLYDGEGRYELADDVYADDYWYYRSDALNKALADALSANETKVKNALEAYMAANEEAIEMDLTDENGKTVKKDLDLGLWLCVETCVPEMVTSTTDPFFVSLPMTTVSGDANSASPEGGHFWNYDVIVYPKNNTGIPSLEKTVRESVRSTGTNGGTDAITDGFDHVGTASAGDILEYQIISTLPTITSKATSLSTYQFYDSICAGISYNKTLKDVKIEVFTDKDCTDKVTTWLQADGRFTVNYSSDDRHMTVDITEAGLAEINGNTANINGKLYAGYSNYTARVTYSATVNSDDSFAYGDEGNCNEVVLTWRRTSSAYYDTQIDDCHVFSFGIELTKLFSDVDPETATENELYQHVKFKAYNTTDGYWLTAVRDEETGIYYVTGHVTEEADATIFYPCTTPDGYGRIKVLGTENDSYNWYECETANGYTLLKDEICVEISVDYDRDRLCDVYAKDVLGVLQNDPHYSFAGDGDIDLHLAGIPQKYLEHYFLTADATVDYNDVTMQAQDSSENAVAPLMVVNTKGFDLPETGDDGVMVFTVTGILLMAGALLVITLVSKKKEHK